VEDSEIVELSPSTVSEFVAWAAALPYERVDEIRRQVAENCDDVVVESLAAKLARAEELDSAHLEIVLAILGESRRESAISPLRRFVWATKLFEPEVFGPIDLEEGVIDCKLWFDHGTMFRARSAEMLGFINTAVANESILEVVREHPEGQVRHAAIDAFMYNHGDSGEAEEEIRRHLQREDVDWVNLPRRTAEMDGKQFDDRLAALHAETEPPPIPDPYPGKRPD
jgi:hypothetical protein